MYGVTEEGDTDGKILVIPDMFATDFCGQSQSLELSKMT